VLVLLGVWERSDGGCGASFYGKAMNGMAGGGSRAETASYQSQCHRGRAAAS
jgi:hypothetical protein